MLWEWGGIHVGCVAVVLGLTQFCVQHLGNKRCSGLGHLSAAAVSLYSIWEIRGVPVWDT